MSKEEKTEKAEKTSKIKRGAGLIAGFLHKLQDLWFGKIYKGKVREFNKKYLSKGFIAAGVLAICLNTYMEIFARHSLSGWLGYVFGSPLICLYNTIIIFAFVSIAVIFRKRIFWFIIMALPWVTVGTINGVILSFRMTPFTTKDLAIFDDGLTIVSTYLSPVEMVLAGFGVCAILALLVVIFIKSPKHDMKHFKKNLVIVVLIVAGAVGMFFGGVKAHLVDTYFANLAYAYEDNGVPYCFISTWLDTGIDKPDNYSEKTVKQIFRNGELENRDAVRQAESEEDLPNIIMLQLESYMDPERVSTISCDGDAIPNFRALEETCSTGWLTVPSIGAGTANTEFEVMTGISSKFFGPGEYPYKTVLTENTCETIAFDLKELGYGTHAVHNHRGVFYNRNIVFGNLGYDTFTSLEYMQNIEQTAKNWAKDNIMTDEIMMALNSTDSRDYVYAITVQTHGRYSTEPILPEGERYINVESSVSEDQKWQYDYYINMLYEMDMFIGDLIDELEKYDEPTIVCMYGDHLPALDMTQDQLSAGTLYQTQYLIWANYPIEKVDQDLYAYEIGSEVLKRVGIENGTIVSYYENYKGDDDYLKNLEILGYDLIYGESYALGGKKYDPVDMRMGVNEIKVNDIVKIGNKYYIKGENFTKYSTISLDGEILKTTYLGPGLLALEEDVDPESAPELKVSQVEKYNAILSTTE